MDVTAEVKRFIRRVSDATGSPPQEVVGLLRQSLDHIEAVTVNWDELEFEEDWAGPTPDSHHFAIDERPEEALRGSGSIR